MQSADACRPPLGDHRPTVATPHQIGRAAVPGDHCGVVCRARQSRTVTTAGSLRSFVSTAAIVSCELAVVTGAPRRTSARTPFAGSIPPVRVIASRACALPEPATSKPRGLRCSRTLPPTGAAIAAPRPPPRAPPRTAVDQISQPGQHRNSFDVDRREGSCHHRAQPRLRGPRPARVS
jgi:hypothetical protein